MWQVFLSHSSADVQFVRRLALDLRAHDIAVWFDEWEMQVGDSLHEKIAEGIQGSGYLAVVLSPDSVQSRWVNVELNAAFQREIRDRDVFVLPILYRQCNIPPFLQDKLYADFTHDYNYGLVSLLQKVGSIDYAGFPGTTFAGLDLAGILQSVIDRCAVRMGATVSIVDLHGSTFTSTTVPFGPFATMMRSLEGTRTQCYDADWVAFRRAEVTGASTVYEGHMGLVDIAMPISVDGKTVGCLFTGQRRIRDPDETIEAHLRQLEQSAGLPPGSLLQKLHDVPLASPSEITRMTRQLSVTARQLSSRLGGAIRMRCKGQPSARAPKGRKRWKELLQSKKGHRIQRRRKTSRHHSR